MKKAIIAIAIVGLLVGAWLFDQANQAPTVVPSVVQQSPQPQQPRGADDMRSLKIP